MFNRKSTKRYNSYWSEIPPQVNTTIASRPSVKPIVKEILDRHLQHIRQLLKNTAADVDAVNVLNPRLDADINCAEAQLCEKEPERADFFDLLRGAQTAGLIIEEAIRRQKEDLIQSCEEQLAAAKEEGLI